jgi:hypothetical protein
MIRGCPQTRRGCPQTIRGCPQTIRGCPQTVRGCPQMVCGKLYTALSIYLLNNYNFWAGLEHKRCRHRGN